MRNGSSTSVRCGWLSLRHWRLAAGHGRDSRYATGFVRVDRFKRFGCSFCYKRLADSFTQTRDVDRDDPLFKVMATNARAFYNFLVALHEQSPPVGASTQWPRSALIALGGKGGSWKVFDKRYKHMLQRFHRFCVCMMFYCRYGFIVGYWKE